MVARLENRYVGAVEVDPADDTALLTALRAARRPA
jgi:hypothetical protein